MRLSRSANVRGNNSTYSLAAKAQTGFQGGRITLPEKQWWRSAWNGITAYIEKRIVTRREAMSMRLSEPILLNRFVALKEAIFVSWKRRARTTSWEDTSMIIRFFFFLLRSMQTCNHHISSTVSGAFRLGKNLPLFGMKHWRKVSRIFENAWKYTFLKKKKLIVERTTLRVCNFEIELHVYSVVILYVAGIFRPQSVARSLRPITFTHL